MSTVESTLDDWLDPMNVSVAREIRNEMEHDRREFRTPHEKNADYIDVMIVGEGIVVVTHNYERSDYAWSGDVEDQEVFDELVDEGLLQEH